MPSAQVQTTTVQKVEHPVQTITTTNTTVVEHKYEKPPAETVATYQAYQDPQPYDYQFTDETIKPASTSLLSLRNIGLGIAAFLLCAFLFWGLFSLFRRLFAPKQQFSAPAAPVGNFYPSAPSFTIAKPVIRESDVINYQSPSVALEDVNRPNLGVPPQGFQYAYFEVPGSSKSMIYLVPTGGNPLTRISAAPSETRVVASDPVLVETNALMKTTPVSDQKASSGAIPPSIQSTASSLPSVVTTTETFIVDNGGVVQKALPPLLNAEAV